MKLHQKLLLGFACVALLVSCVGYVAQQTNARVAHSVEQWQQVAVQELLAASEMQAAYHEAIIAVYRRDGARIPEARLAADSALAHQIDRFEVAASRARSAVTAGLTRADQLGRADRAERQREKLAWLAEATAAVTAQRLLYEQESTAEAGIHRATVESALYRFREAARAGFDTEATAVRAELSRADRFLFGAVLLGIGLTLVLGVLIAHSIAGPLGVLAEAARTLGEGRLDHRVALDGPEEVGALGEALNAMATHLDRTTVSRADVETILRSMADPLLLTDLDGTITLANEAALATLGRDEEALVGQPLGTVMRSAAVPVEALISRALRDGTARVHDVQLVRADGDAVPVAFSAAVLRRLDGQVRGLVCVAKDISEQKRIEQQLDAARQRAEDMARMKSSFLANMSHEIRTPLTGIIGSAQVLSEIAEGDALEIASIVERAGVRLLGTINTVLDMARLEAGGFHPDREPLRLSEEVRDAVRVLRPLAEARGLGLHVVEREPGLAALADPGFLNRIVTNLVGNAIKFTETGSVTVELDRAATSREVTLRVVDTGIGISPAFVPHLFDEFRQESTGMHRRHEGTGLGLAITQRLVELLGGTITVESRLGEGTTFTVTLAAAVSEERLLFPSTGDGVAGDLEAPTGSPLPRIA